MSDAGEDASSEDSDYAPSTKEVERAEREKSRNKRQKRSEPSENAGIKVAGGSAKVDEMWQSLQSNRKPSPRASTSQVALLSSQGRSRVASADEEWMKQLLRPGVRDMSKLIKPSHSAAPNKLEQTVQTWSASTQATQGQAAAIHTRSEPLNTPAAAAALAAAKTAMTSADAQSTSQSSIVETRRFAGKDVQVRKVVDFQNKMGPEKANDKPTGAGLDAVLASLETAKKVTVLDKSRDDWGNFKSEDAHINEELEAYKKSGGKYLDKVDFLKRTELREFAAERDKRLH